MVEALPVIIALYASITALAGPQSTLNPEFGGEWVVERALHLNLKILNKVPTYIPETAKLFGMSSEGRELRVDTRWPNNQRIERVLGFGLGQFAPI